MARKQLAQIWHEDTTSPSPYVYGGAKYRRRGAGCVYISIIFTFPDFVKGSVIRPSAVFWQSDVSNILQHGRSWPEEAKYFSNETEKVKVGSGFRTRCALCLYMSFLSFFSLFRSHITRSRKATIHKMRAADLTDDLLTDSYLGSRSALCFQFFFQFRNARLNKSQRKNLTSSDPHRPIISTFMHLKNYYLTV